MVPAPPLTDRVTLDRSWSPMEPQFSCPFRENSPHIALEKAETHPQGPQVGRCGEAPSV